MKPQAAEQVLLRHGCRSVLDCSIGSSDQASIGSSDQATSTGTHNICSIQFPAVVPKQIMLTTQIPLDWHVLYPGWPHMYVHAWPWAEGSSEQTRKGDAHLRCACADARGPRTGRAARRPLQTCPAAAARAASTRCWPRPRAAWTPAHVPRLHRSGCDRQRPPSCVCHRSHHDREFYLSGSPIEALGASLCGQCREKSLQNVPRKICNLQCKGSNSE